MRKVAIKRGRGQNYSFALQNLGVSLKGALESGWGDKSPEFMPASDQIKDGKDSTEIARQRENLPEYTCRRFDFRRQAKYLLPTELGRAQAAL